MAEKAELTSKEWRAFGVLVEAAKKRLERYDLDSALAHLNDFIEMLED